MAKPRDGGYEPNGRAMIKVKHERTCDAVVAGYRLHKTSTEEKPLLGSLLLGLYDAEGRLQHIGVSAAFAAARRAELIEELEPLLVDPKDHPWRQWAEAEAHQKGRLPGARLALERQEGPVLDPDRPGARGRGRATTTWRAPGSGIPRSSSAGGPTGRPSRAPTTSSRRS